MRKALLFVFALSASACTLDFDDGTSQTGQNVVTHNRLASNRLASNRLASNRLASNRLASNSISANELIANGETAQLLETADGRDVYSYLISCALGPDTHISADLNYLPAGPCAANQRCIPADTDCDNPGPNGENCPNYSCDGGVCTFDGNLGLAPRWESRRLDMAGRGWVSSCIFSRVSALDTAVAISLRGEVDSLAVGEDEASTFNLQEGAFYGNLFVDNPDESVPPDWNACSGKDSDLLTSRRCTQPSQDPEKAGLTECGFKYTGDCADHDTAVASPYACRTADSVTVGTTSYTTYDNCYDSDGLGRWPHSQRARQVITVYVSTL